MQIVQTRTLCDIGTAVLIEVHIDIGMSRYGALASIEHMLPRQGSSAVVLNKNVYFLTYMEFERGLPGQKLRFW